jgi:hypothetical protein
MRFELPVLLSARLCGVERIVLSAHNHGVLDGRGVEDIRDVERERGLAALVLADEAAVHPHPGPVVHGPEPKVQTLCPGRPGTESRGTELVDPEPAGVPDDGVESGVVDAGVGRLERERHPDGAGELGRGKPAARLAHVVVVELEPPVAAQLVPGRPHELRTRIVTVLPAGTEITREGACANAHTLHHARTKKRRQ